MKRATSYSVPSDARAEHQRGDLGAVGHVRVDRVDRARAAAGCPRPTRRAHEHPAPMPAVAVPLVVCESVCLRVTALVAASSIVDVSAAPHVHRAGQLPKGRAHGIRAVEAWRPRRPTAHKQQKRRVQVDSRALSMYTVVVLVTVDAPTKAIVGNSRRRVNRWLVIAPVAHVTVRLRFTPQRSLCSVDAVEIRVRGAGHRERCAPDVARQPARWSPPR